MTAIKTSSHKYATSVNFWLNQTANVCLEDVSFFDMLCLYETNYFNSLTLNLNLCMINQYYLKYSLQFHNEIHGI